MKGNYTIHSLCTLHACFGHNEYTPLCQVHIKDILLHTDVQQLMSQRETNLLIEINRPDVNIQEKALGFHTNFHGPVYLSIGPEAKRDIYNTFDPDKSISIHLDPPLTERPPLVEIKQEGKNSIYTTDFYFTNKSPSNIVVLSPSQNNTTPTGDKAAADPSLFDTDLLQPGEIRLHSWMLYTSQTPILDLTGKDIKSMKDIEHAFHALNLCPKENNEEIPNGREETGGTNKFK